MELAFNEPLELAAAGTRAAMVRRTMVRTVTRVETTQAVETRDAAKVAEQVEEVAKG